MMRQQKLALCLCGLIVVLSTCGFPALGNAQELQGLSVAERQELAGGRCIVLTQRPDESDRVDHRFVTVAALLEGSRKVIWEVINDKENAASFLDGVLESKVIKRDGNTLLVEQRTRVGGPRGSYRYRLRHELTPMSRADFTYVEGELRNILGTWWIFDGADASHCLLVYSLHIDPGVLAPQPVVKSGMRKTMPKTIHSITAEVERRSKN